MSARLFPLTEQVLIVVADAATSLPFPPNGNSVLVPTSWIGASGSGVVPELDVDIWSDTDTTLTNAELLSGKKHPLVVADTVFTADHMTGELTAVAHGLETGDGPVRVSSTMALPAGLVAATDYFVIKVDADTFELAASLVDALAENALALTGDGTGVETLSDTSSTRRIHWHSIGKIGTVELGATRGATVRLDNSPLVVAYAFIADSSNGSAHVSVALAPISELGA